jgi:hypothetical protein
MRDVVCIYTGQGAAGDFKKIAIFTGQFSSCSPVVMFNEKTGRGGLYHLPGKAGDAKKLKNDEWDNLLALLALVKPDTIILFPSGDYANRQGFIEGTVKPPGLFVSDSDFVEAEEDEEKAMAIAFDRVYKGDLNALSNLFAQAKAAQIMSHNVQVQERAESMRGIQVTASEEGKLEISGQAKSLGGKVYDLKKKQFPPKELCAILNPNIEYHLWIGASIN